MSRFRRGDISPTLEPSPWGTVRDFAMMAFRAHRGITDVEVLAATPAAGTMTVRFATEREGQWEAARFACYRWFEERGPVNCNVVIEQLHRDARPGEQMGLLGG